MRVVYSPNGRQRQTIKQVYEGGPWVSCARLNQNEPASGLSANYKIAGQCITAEEEEDDL